MKLQTVVLAILLPLWCVASKYPVYWDSSIGRYVWGDTAIDFSAEESDPDYTAWYNANRYGVGEARSWTIWTNGYIVMNVEIDWTVTNGYRHAKEVLVEDRYFKTNNLGYLVMRNEP